MGRRHDDPVAGLRRRERRAWRRRERAIVASHQADLAAALGGLVGSPVLALSVGPTGTVTLEVPGWRVGLAGVSASAQAALAGRAQQTCHIAGAGRYGRFWWLAVAATAEPDTPPAVVLGAYARVHPVDGGRPPGSPPAARKEYSLS
jgi:hypothetical protein